MHLLRQPEGEWLLLDSRTRLGPAGTGLASTTFRDVTDGTSRVVGTGAQTLVVSRADLGWRRAPAARRARPGQRHVGDLAGNAAAVREWTGEPRPAGAHLVAFPEMFLTGYPVEDLALRRSFVEASVDALHQLAADLAADGLGELPVVVGYLDRARGRDIEIAELTEEGELSEDGRTGIPKGMPQNCAAVLYGGQVVARYAKHHLPNYGVFDEFRIFVPGPRPDRRPGPRRRHRDRHLRGPLAGRRPGGQDPRRPAPSCCWSINGSPYERNKDDTRLALTARRAGEAGCTLAYVNLVGGQDELVFDGDSLVVDVRGRGAGARSAVPARTCWSSTST